MKQTTTIELTLCYRMSCQKCRNEEKEAFLYMVVDGNGDNWGHLCNDCYESLPDPIETFPIKTEQGE